LSGREIDGRFIFRTYFDRIEPAVIASEAKQSRLHDAMLDCFAEPVIGPREARTRWLAMTGQSDRTPLWMICNVKSAATRARPHNRGSV
jgi:hypothetical protein